MLYAYEGSSIKPNAAQGRKVIEYVPKYQVTVVRLDNIHPAVCQGALVSENMVLTPAQCVAHAQPQNITIRTQGGGNIAYAIGRIIVNDRYNPATLYPDVALLQLQNATRVAATGARSIPIDWQQQHWDNCTVNVPHNTTGVPDQTWWFANVHRPCDRFNGRNLTTCTGYQLTNTSQCAVSSTLLRANMFDTYKPPENMHSNNSHSRTTHRTPQSNCTSIAARRWSAAASSPGICPMSFGRHARIRWPRVRPVGPPITRATIAPPPTG